MCIQFWNLFKNRKIKNKYKTFTILGDSYSAFKDYVNPDYNFTYYPIFSIENINQMWFSLFSKETGVKMVQNNSFSGSPICYDGFGDGKFDAEGYSFVERAKNLKQSDLIIIEGATNDSFACAEVGEYKYENITKEDLCYFRPALSYLLSYLKDSHANSEIVFMLNNELRDDINESVKTICEYYNVKLLYLHDIDKENMHPTKNGMVTIKNQLIDLLKR